MADMNMGWSNQALSYMKKLSCMIVKAHYLPFIVQGVQCGLIAREYAKPFQDEVGLFDVSEERVRLICADSTSRSGISDALNSFFSKLRDEGIFSFTLKGNRNKYIVIT